MDACRWQVHRGGFGRLNNCGREAEPGTSPALCKRHVKQAKQERLVQEHAEMKALLERLAKGTSKPRSPMLAALEADARKLLAKIKGA